jgi:hypothetical protein
MTPPLRSGRFLGYARNDGWGWAARFQPEYRLRAVVDDDAVFPDDHQRVFQVDRGGMPGEEVGEQSVDGRDVPHAAGQIEVDDADWPSRRGEKVVAVILVQGDDHSALSAGQPDHLMIGQLAEALALERCDVQLELFAEGAHHRGARMAPNRSLTARATTRGLRSGLAPERQMPGPLPRSQA